MPYLCEVTGFWTTLPARASSGDTLDYITRGLARFRDVAEAGGFEVGEVTLSFDEDQQSVLLRVNIGIDAGLLKALEPAPAAGPSQT